MDADFSPPVKQFIDEHIHSVAQLEVLLALHQNPDALWTIEQVTSRFYFQPQMANELLIDLVRRGLVAQQGAAFRYAPADTAIAPLIDELAKLYRERRVAVTSRIFSKPAGSDPKFPRKFGSCESPGHE